MHPTDIIKELMGHYNATYGELAEYADLKSKQNAWKLVNAHDIKLSTFVTMLETLGCQLIVKSLEFDFEEVVDCDA